MSLPVYRRIHDDLAQQIDNGELPPGGQLPTENSLAAQYGVSRMTVRQALKQLEDEQLLTRRKGSGTYVSQRSAGSRKLNRLQSFDEELGLESNQLITVVLHLESIDAPPDIVDRLELKSGEQVTFLERRRLLAGRPIALQRSWVPYRVAPTLARLPLVADSLYRTLRERYGVSLAWAEQEVRAELAVEDTASALDVAVGSPLLVTSRVTLTAQQEPVEFANSWTTGDRPLSIRLEAW